MMATQASNLLRTRLEDLKRRRPGTSLRGLARSVGVSPSYLCKVVNGRKPCPAALVPRLAKALRLDPLDRRALLRKPDVRPASAPRPEVAFAFDALGPDSHAWLLAKWHRIAVLNLATVAGFKAEAPWIARRLGISVDDASESLRALLAGGLLVRRADGSAVRDRVRLRLPTDRSHPAVRDYHSAWLRRALRELDVDAASDERFTRRLIAGLSVAGDSRKFEAARNMIHEALYRVAEFLADGDCDEVFHLAVQALPETRPEIRPESDSRP